MIIMKIISLELQKALGQKAGIGWYTYNIIKGLVSKNKNKYILEAFNFNRKYDIGEIEIWKKEALIKQNIFFPKKIGEKLSYVIPYNFLFNTNSEIYHFFNFTIPKKIKGKVIVTIHDMIYKVYPETTEIKNLQNFHKKVKFAIENSDKIIAVSEATKKDILKYFNIQEKKIDIVSPGIYLEDYMKDDNDDILSKYKLPNSYILYLGTLEPRKNIINIIKSFEKYKKENKSKIQLVLVGKKGWKYEKIFQAYEESPYKEEIKILGYIDEKDKVLLYKNAKVFLYPSFYEGFGMPILEAMAAGTPVITSNISSLPEVAGNAAILVNPYDINEILDAMREVLNNEKLRKNMIALGFNQANKYTWEKSVEKLEKIYEDL